MLIMLGAVGSCLGGYWSFQLIVKPAMMRKFSRIGVIRADRLDGQGWIVDWQGEFQAWERCARPRRDIAPEVPGVITESTSSPGRRSRPARRWWQLNAESDLARLSRSRRCRARGVNYQRDQKQLEIQAVSGQWWTPMQRI